MGSKVVFIADSLDNAYRFRQALSSLDVEVSAGSTMQVKKLLASGTHCDLVVFEARNGAFDLLAEVESLAEDCGSALLVIVDEEKVVQLRLPTIASCDFVVHGAGTAECLARVKRLLQDDGSGLRADTIAVDEMVINLATYQVTVDGAPVDFTYLEYALLSFLARHPGHTFSRDALLQHVWGFDYYGGSRTVDVHVRRIRAKLGPELAQRLETVRGVGYLWNA